MGLEEVVLHHETTSEVWSKLNQSTGQALKFSPGHLLAASMGLSQPCRPFQGRRGRFEAYLAARHFLLLLGHHFLALVQL